MANLGDFIYTDGIDTVHAKHINDLLAATLRAEYRNVETISATRALLDTDTPIQVLTPSGADRAVTLPAPDDDNHAFFVVNADDTYSLTLPNTWPNILPGRNSLIVPDGSAWHLISDGVMPNAISGLQLRWTATDGITVTDGMAVLPNGKRLMVYAPIAKTALALSADTWYHVYLFDDGGTPDTEIVTTIPTAPYFGTARAKTGDTSRRYIGSVRTNASAEILNFYESNNFVFYRINFSAKRVLSNGDQIAETTIDASAFVPVTSRMAMLRIFNGATTGLLATGTSDDSVTAPGVSGITLTGTGSTTVTPHSLDAEQKFTYWYNVSPVGGFAFIDVFGYYLER
jgi:hypothetical protein